MQDAIQTQKNKCTKAFEKQNKKTFFFFPSDDFLNSSSLFGLGPFALVCKTPSKFFSRVHWSLQSP